MKNDIGYVIRFRPFIWEEDSDGEMYHSRYNKIDEFFTDENEFNERLTQLESGVFEDLDGSIYDGVDIEDVFECELRQINWRLL